MIKLLDLLAAADLPDEITFLKLYVYFVNFLFSEERSADSSGFKPSLAISKPMSGVGDYFFVLIINVLFMFMLESYGAVDFTNLGSDKKSVDTKGNERDTDVEPYCNTSSDRTCHKDNGKQESDE